VIAAVSYVAPWHQLTNEPFMTAVAFERALGSRWIVSVILASALLSLFKVFNGNLVAASRLVFAMSRRGLLDPHFAFVHPANQTPATAVLAVGIATGLCMFLGSAILVPISEVGSVASATGWTAACLAYLKLTSSSTTSLSGVEPRARDRAIAIVGTLVGFSMIVMKLVPAIPGHFSSWEWLAFILWAVFGSGAYLISCVAARGASKSEPGMRNHE
jgi:amino acid transporter